MLEEVPAAQVIIGGGLYFLPGLVWVWALVPDMPWPHRIPVAVVVAFTLQPALLFVLHLFLRVPIALPTIAALCAGLAVAGFATWTLRSDDRWALG